MGTGATEKDLFEIIRCQSEQIDQLMTLLANSGEGSQTPHFSLPSRDDPPRRTAVFDFANKVLNRTKTPVKDLNTVPDEFLGNLS